MRDLLFIAIGGAAGAVLRYLVAGWGQRLTDASFPSGTLVVNLIGCLLIGLLASLLTGPFIVREEVRLGVLVGLLGGFTTFSTFGLETLSLLEDREYGLALVNVTLSNGMGLGGVWIGQRFAFLWHGG